MYVGGDIFDPFAKTWPYLKLKNRVRTKNWIQVLHHKWSFIFCFISLTCITGYTTLIEEQIDCFGPKEEEISPTYLKFFCWAFGTYTVPEYLDKKIGVDVAHPGVGSDDNVGKTTRMYHTQYIFYPLVFLIQVGSFRLSYKLWKKLEGDRLARLLSELSSPIVTPEKVKERMELVVTYMTQTPTLTFHDFYSKKYIFCEVYNMVNIFSQFFCFNYILHGGFITYGHDVIQYLRGEARFNPFDYMFPKVTKCSIKKYGVSGNFQPMEALCIMPINNFAEKIFLFTWFWLLIIGAITALGLAYRLLVVCAPRARYSFLLMRSMGSGVNPRHIRYFVNHSSYGDWFVVSLMQKNMSPWVFAQFMEELTVKMMENRRNKDKAA